MIQYLDKTKSLIKNFDKFSVKQIPKGENRKADALSKIASTSFAHLSKQVLVETLKNKSISEMEISTVIEEEHPTWMTPIIDFISKGTLPQEQKDARWYPISAFILTTMASVRRTSSGRIRTPRNPRWVLQHALRTTVRCSASFVIWILLAYHAPRRVRHDQKMQ